MTTLTHAVQDSATMLRRDFKHTLRYPVMAVSTVLSPMLMLALFVYVLGGQLGGGSRSAYLAYVVPGLIVLTAGSGSAATAVNLATDMNEGIIPRFRTMAFFRPAVLVGQAVGSVLRSLLSMALVVCVALALGFRAHGPAAGWLAAAGVAVLFVIAMTWLATALGLLAKTAAGANSSTLPLQFLLPFLSSAFVDPATMPSGLRWFARNQPFTQVIDTLRGLLAGTPVGHSAAYAVAWCVGLTLVGYFWSKAVFLRPAA